MRPTAGASRPCRPGRDDLAPLRQTDQPQRRFERPRGGGSGAIRVRRHSSSGADGRRTVVGGRGVPRGDGAAAGRHPGVRSGRRRPALRTAITAESARRGARTSGPTEGRIIRARSCARLPSPSRSARAAVPTASNPPPVLRAIDRRLRSGVAASPLASYRSPLPDAARADTVGPRRVFSRLRRAAVTFHRYTPSIFDRPRADGPVDLRGEQQSHLSDVNDE